MKRTIVFIFAFVFGLMTMACDNANAVSNDAKNESMKYAFINATGYTGNYVALYDRQTEAALQQGLTNAGFINSKDSGVAYKAVANWSDDKQFVTICITSQSNTVLMNSERIMPAGCINVSSKETGISNAVGVALLPKAAEKLALMLKDQIEGKAMPTQNSESEQIVAKPEKAPATNAANTKK